MNLRLNTIADMVDINSRVADIGTDHAYLPIELVKSNKINFAIASDIGKGPIENAKKDIDRAELNTKITTRLGPGLSTITSKDQIDSVVIAGMGGKLIIQILNDAWAKNKHFQTLILEPNISEPNVRKWLIEHKYKIVNEKLIAEAGHTYEIIKAVQSKHHSRLSEKEIYFGPFILRAKGAVFIKKWQGQLIYHQKLLANLNKAKQKDKARINKIEHEISMIEEELND